MIKQTGLLFSYSPTDYITGASPILQAEINPTGDWRDYLPSDEKQFKDFTFDTMSCTTFSAINVVETQINFFIKNKKFTLTQELLLNDYIDEKGKVNFSDRFTAIMSGTTKQGNYFQKVWDSIRKDGLLPEKDFPFGGNSWEEYHDPKNITEGMKTKAKKILELIDFAYEWVSFTPNIDLSGALKHAPLHGGIPNPAYHAVELPSANYIYDTYDPFLYERQVPVSYTLKGIVKIKTIPVVTLKTIYKYFKDSEVKNLQPTLVTMLDDARGYAGVPFKITSGFRTVAQNLAVGGVPNSNHISGMAADIACNESNRFKIVTGALKAGFTRIEVCKNHIHLDIGTYPDPWMGVALKD